MKKRHRTKIVAVLLCVSLFAGICAAVPGVSAAVAGIYEEKASQAVVDGVLYAYRNSIDVPDEIQITAIRVPDGMSNLVLPEVIDGRTVSALHLRKEDGAEMLAGVTSLTLPKTMTYQGIDWNPTCSPRDPAINGNYLVPSLNDYFTGLEEVKVAADHPCMVVKDGVLFNKEVSQLLYYPYNKRDAEYVEPDTIRERRLGADYSGRRYLKKLTYSQNEDCSYTVECSNSNIETVVIPNNVKYIWMDSFSHCTKLKHVQWHDGIQVIHNNAFAYCTSLEKITMPKGLKGIEKGAFRGCSSLRSIVLPDGLQWMQAYAFYGTKCKKVTIPDSVTGMGKNAFSKETKVKKQSYLKSANAKYVSKSYYTHSYYSYIAMATVINTKSGKKKCYPSYYINKIWGKKKITLKKGKKRNLNTKGTLSLYGEKTKSGYIGTDILAYTSSNPKAVKVTGNGIVKARKKGKATIRVKLRTRGSVQCAGGYKITVRVR